MPLRFSWDEHQGRKRAARALFLAALCILSALAGSSPAPRKVYAVSSGGIGYGVNGGWDRLDSVKAMGFNWVKLTVSWKQYEPSRGNYQVSNLDSTVDRAVSRGFKILIRVDDTPDWASSSPGAYNAPPANDADLANFMYALVSRFKGKVQAYEIWNETNLNYEWGFQNPDPVRYGNMLKAIYPKIKQADPDAIVVSGGLSTAGDGTEGPYLGDLYYLAKLFDPNQDGNPVDGYGAYLDAVGTHPYGGPYRYDTPPSVAQYDVGTYFRRAEQQHEVVVTWGKTDKPFWATEFGWFVDPAEDGLGSCSLPEHFQRLKVTSQSQSDNLVGAYQYAAQTWPWMGPMFFFNFDMAADPWRSQCEQVRFFSIMKGDGTYRPAYNALKNMPKAAGAFPTASPASPSNGATVTTLGPTLTWTNPSGATQYHLEVTPYNNDGAGINIIRNVSTNFSVPPPPGWYGMLPGMTYYWRVRTTTATTSVGVDDPAWGQWSATWSFKTPPPSSATLSLVSPKAGETASSLTPNLIWKDDSPSIFYYEVQVSLDPSFDPWKAFLYWEMRHGGVTSPLNSYSVPSQYPLEPGKTYYWRVRPRVQGDGTPVPWGSTWAFKTP